MRVPRRSAAVSLGVVCLVVACGTASPPPPRFVIDYTSVGNHPEAATLPVRLGVARFEARPMYDRLSIAWREDEAYGYYTTGKWADLPSSLVTDAVCAAARTHGGFADVRRVPETWGEQPELVLRGRIEAFEEVTDKAGRHARVALRAAVTDASARATYWEGLAEHREPVGGQGVEALVRAFRAAQAQVADELVAQARRVAAEQVQFDKVSGSGGRQAQTN